MTEFSEFWVLYPRRVAKKDAERAWNRLTEAQQVAAILALPAHVRYWNIVGRTKETTPHPASWLNGERWDDEVEVPSLEGEWWKSQRGIEEKARETGCWPAKANEGWHELKNRVLAKMAA